MNRSKAHKNPGYVRLHVSSASSAQSIVFKVVPEAGSPCIDDVFVVVLLPHGEVSVDAFAGVAALLPKAQPQGAALPPTQVADMVRLLGDASTLGAGALSIYLIEGVNVEQNPDLALAAALQAKSGRQGTCCVSLGDLWNQYHDQVPDAVRSALLENAEVTGHPDLGGDHVLARVTAQVLEQLQLWNDASQHTSRQGDATHPRRVATNTQYGHRRSSAPPGTQGRSRGYQGDAIVGAQEHHIEYAPDEGQMLSCSLLRYVGGMAAAAAVNQLVDGSTLAFWLNLLAQWGVAEWGYTELVKAQFPGIEQLQARIRFPTVQHLFPQLSPATARITALVAGRALVYGLPLLAQLLLCTPRAPVMLRLSNYLSGSLRSNWEFWFAAATIGLGVPVVDRLVSTITHPQFHVRDIDEDTPEE
jgi:hypothetical protein